MTKETTGKAYTDTDECRTFAKLGRQSLTMAIQSSSGGLATIVMAAKELVDAAPPSPFSNDGYGSTPQDKAAFLKSDCTGAEEWRRIAVGCVGVLSVMDDILRHEAKTTAMEAATVSKDFFLAMMILSNRASSNSRAN